LTVLNVEKAEGDKLTVSYPPNHPKAERIKEWLKYLSPGYVEYLVQFGEDPHCTACRDAKCENRGMGDDACPGFKFGEEW
jgi:hypothetical protein